jgi:hypothetical protein
VWLDDSSVAEFFDMAWTKSLTIAALSVDCTLRARTARFVPARKPRKMTLQPERHGAGGVALVHGFLVPTRTASVALDEARVGKATMRR